MHIVDLLKDERRPTAGGFSLNPGRARLLKTVKHLAANFITDMLAGVEADAFA